MKKYKLIVYFKTEYDGEDRAEYDIDSYGDAVPGVFMWEEDGVTTYMPWENISWLMVKENSGKL